MARVKLYVLVALFVITLVSVQLLYAESVSHLKFLPTVLGGYSDQPASCWRPYSAGSPWNALISDTGLNYHEDSASFIQTLSNAQDGGSLDSNPDLNTYSVYEVTNQTLPTTVTFSAVFSNVLDDGKTLESLPGGGTVQVPIPDHVTPLPGTSVQIIIVNIDTGDEWAFADAQRDGDGNWSATNGYHYNINWDAVMPDGFMSRGAGVSFLSGLIRKCEIENGSVDHALAFAYDFPCSSSVCNSNGYPHYVWPASKSDGKGEESGDIPQGARLHISPPPTDSELHQWCGADSTCEIIVNALEKYGMFVIGNADHAKMYPESNDTANWGNVLSDKTVQNIPLSRFKVLEFPAFQPPSCRRAYSDDSPWNTPVSETGLNYHENNDSFIQTLANAQDGSSLGSNPDNYTYPVYEVTNQTPLITVTFSGVFSNVINDGKTLERKSGGGTVQVPIPDNANPSPGTDSQIIIINIDTGDEWAFWVAKPDGNGNWSARNGYHYNINWNAVMPDGFTSRGAGVSYLSGLIRKCEIENGSVDHAIAFAYDYPCSRSVCNSNGYPYFVWPASKSDGKGEEKGDLPEGARLHISPPPTDSELQQWCGSDPTCEIIVDALEKYGMFVIDNSGHAKMYPESNVTANWGDTLTDKTVRNIPLSRFKVLEFSSYP